MERRWKRWPRTSSRMVSMRLQRWLMARCICADTNTCTASASDTMTPSSPGRRRFMQSVASAAAIAALPKDGFGMAVKQSARPRIRFSVIGINHSHINSQVNAVLRGGGELVSLYAAEDDLAAAFLKTFPQARGVQSEKEILEDPSIQLVLSSAIPDQRAPIGIRVMQHGKDYMADKPGITTLEQLAEARKVQAQTKRIYSILYS